METFGVSRQPVADNDIQGFEKCVSDACVSFH